MQVSVTGRNIDVTPPLRQYVEGKLARVKRHFDHLIDVHVILDVDKHDQRAEAAVSGSGAKFFADARNPDMYAAIDLMIDKLDRQVLKHKDKLKDHSHDVSIRDMNPG